MLPTQQPSSSISKTPKPSIPLPFIAMKDRPSLSSYGAIYIPPHLRLRSVVTSANYNNNSGPVAPKLRENTPPTPTTLQTPLPEKRSSRYVSAYDDAVSEEGSDREFEVPSLPSGSHNDNIDEWKRKLTMFLNDKSKQELISREKKDRRDFEKIAVLASRMGLYSHVYAKVVVFSKVPLPNYRYDLDDRRPQREVSMPITMFRQVDAYFEEYLNQKSRVNKSFSDLSFARSSSSGSIGTDEGLFEQPEPLASSKTVAEKVLRWRSLEMLDQQQAWQESPEGKRMLEFRSSLPAYKEREAILSVISRNQVVIISGETGCGKTTQIPQFILESEIESVRGAACNIICTQPRRISAMSVSERVASERGEKLGESVGYKVRLEGMKGKDTHLLFCTTGILLRRLLADRNLKGVTHVIVDEIHERGMNEDFLLIVLKDILPHRPELKLILMSATLDAELFSSYFNGAPIMKIPVRYRN